MGTELRGSNDPDRTGSSLANAAEVVIAALDARGAKSVAEVGAYAGDLTRILLEWAHDAGAHVTAIDPRPEPGLSELARGSQFDLVAEPSHAALRRIQMPDALILDGDHNYYTVRTELELVAERSGGSLPLLILHDVLWPHGRRDTYFAPEDIPPEHRQPAVPRGGVFPGTADAGPRGLVLGWPAEREGGARNGVMTALEDFLAAREGLRFAIVPAFFGLAFVWPEDAPWSQSVSATLRPWDRNPLVGRLEANRVYHLARSQPQGPAEQRLLTLAREQRALLRGLLGSPALAIADRIVRLRHGRRATLWRERIADVLDDGEDSIGGD